MKKNVYSVAGMLIVVGVLFLAATKFYQSKDQSDSSQASSTGVSGESRSGAGAQISASDQRLVRDYSPSLGPVVAKTTVVEFLDPECEACRAMHPIVKDILKSYEGRIRYVVRYMPFHQNSELAARWLEAAREQGKYWEALDVLMLKQPEWGAHHAPRPDLIPEYLKTIGVDIKKAEKAKDKPEFGTWVRQDMLDGQSLGVRGTPTFYVNGRLLERLGDSTLRSLIDEELNK